MSAAVELTPRAGRNPVDELNLRLADVRARAVRLNQMLLGLRLACLVLGGGLMLGAIDYFWPLPWLLRMLCLASMAAASIALVVRARRRRYSSHDAAADIEAAFPAIGQRVRTSLDYATGGGEPSPAHASLVRRLHDETEAQTRSAELASVVSSRQLAWWLAGAGAVAIFLAVILAVNGEARITAGRVFLLPLHYTTVVLTPIDKPIPKGATATVRATVSGRPIARAELRFRPVGGKGKWKTALMLPPGATAEAPPEDLSGELASELANLQQDLEVVVEAGPRRLDPLWIRVLQPLELKKSIARIEPPQYAKRPPRTTSEASFTVLEGSNVTLTLRFSRAPEEVMLLPTSEATAAASTGQQATGEKPREKTGEKTSLAPLTLAVTGEQARHTFVDLRQSVQFRIVARTADGVDFSSSRRTIRVQLDRKPQIALAAPAEETEAIPTAEIHFDIAASDDLGLHRVGLAYQVNDGQPKTLWESHDGKTSLTAEAVLALEELQLTFQDAITYHAFAEDSYFGSPRRVTTPLRFIDIRPFKREYQVLQAEGGACKGCSATLEELIARQRTLLKGSFLVRQSAEVDRTATANLAREQKELFDAAMEFTTGMEQRAGPIPPLENACIAMEEAAAELAIPDLDSGFEQQQKALANLILARQNLRQILKQSSSQQASQCRNFDRQQMQKLRPPEPKKSEQPQQQLSQLREQIEKLAEEQKQWSQSASQCQNPSSSSSSASSSSAASSSSQPPSSDSQRPPEQSQSPSPAPQQLAEEQQGNLEQARQIQQGLEQQSAGSPLARERMQSAVEAMEQGLKSMQAGDPGQASEQATDAAQRLDDLSRQLEALGAADLAEKLAAAQQAAARLAEQQSQLAQESERRGQSGKASSLPSSSSSSPAASSTSSSGQQAGAQFTREAAEQSRLARQAEDLHEMLSRLGAEAAGESPETAQRVASATSDHSPQAAAEQMRQAASDLSSGRPDEAAQAGKAAAETLSALSEELRSARDGLAQPRLEELIAAEERAARLLERMMQSGQEAGGAAAQQQIDELADSLERLAAQDDRLAQAVEQMVRPTAGGESGIRQVGGIEEQGGDFVKNSGFGEIGQVRVAGVRRVTQVLQTKLQEAILTGALQDADDAVPPAYREMVEEYYRTLSEDLK